MTLIQSPFFCHKMRIGICLFIHFGGNRFKRTAKLPIVFSDTAINSSGHELWTVKLYDIWNLTHNAAIPIRYPISTTMETGMKRQIQIWRNKSSKRSKRWFHLKSLNVLAAANYAVSLNTVKVYHLKKKHLISILDE